MPVGFTLFFSIRRSRSSFILLCWSCLLDSLSFLYQKIKILIHIVVLVEPVGFTLFSLFENQDPHSYCCAGGACWIYSLFSIRKSRSSFILLCWWCLLDLLSFLYQKIEILIHIVVFNTCDEDLLWSYQSVNLKSQSSHLCTSLVVKE